MPGSTLGQRIKRARRALGLTQEALAKPDLTKGFISLLEHDRAKPSVATLERLAQRLGQPISYFLNDTETRMLDKWLAVLASRGRSELMRRRYDAALTLFTELRQLAAGRSHAKMELSAVLGLGEACLGLRRIEEAHLYLEEALRRSRAANDVLAECRALHGLATAELRRNRFPRAVTLFKAALEVAPALQGAEPVLRGEIYLYLGSAFARMGRADEAIDAFVQARQIFEAAMRPERVGEALMGLGNMLSDTGEFDVALVQYERARVLFEQYEDLQMMSYVRNNLGMLLAQVGRPREALDHFAVSLAIKQRLEDAVGECHTLTELARCHLLCGDRERAQDYAERAIARSRDAAQLDEEARAQIVLGTIAAEAGDYELAQRYLQQAAQRCDELGMAPELVTVFHELARVASSRGHYEEAAAYHEKAFEALRGLPPNGVAAVLHVARAVDPKSQPTLDPPSPQ